MVDVVVVLGALINMRMMKQNVDKICVITIMSFVQMGLVHIVALLIFLNYVPQIYNVN